MKLFNKGFIVNTYHYETDPIQWKQRNRNWWLHNTEKYLIEYIFGEKMPYLVVTINIEDDKYYYELISSHGENVSSNTTDMSGSFLHYLNVMFRDIQEIGDKVPIENRFIFVQYNKNVSAESKLLFQTESFSKYVREFVETTKNYMDPYYSEEIDNIIRSEVRKIQRLQSSLSTRQRIQSSVTRKLLTKSKGLGQLFVGSILYLVTFSWLVEFVVRHRSQNRDPSWTAETITLKMLGISIIPREMIKKGYKEMMEGGFDIKSQLENVKQMLQKRFGSDWFHKVGRKLKAMAPDKLRKLIRKMIEHIRKLLGRPSSAEMPEYRAYNSEVANIFEAMQGNTEPLKQAISKIESEMKGGYGFDSNYYKHKYMKYKYKYLKIK